MSQAMNLLISEYSVNADYLRQLQPVGHLSGAYLQVLLHTARFRGLSQGEIITSRSLRNSIVYLVDGWAEKTQGNVIHQIQGGSCEPLFLEDETGEITIKQKSMIILIDKTLYGIFAKENNYRERLNLA